MSTSVPALASESAVPRAERNRLGEFFRYHGAWAPGVRLFRAIGFRTKAMVIALTLLLPTGQLGWNYFQNQRVQIAFSAKERLGVEYARELLPLLDGLQRQRLAAVQGGGADPAAAAALQANQARLADVQARLGDELGTAAAYAAWLDSARALRTTAGAAALGAHDDGVQALLALLGQATDGSNLTLDPDIDTYYLMDAATTRLPAMAEEAAQLQVREAGLPAAGEAPAAAQTRRIIEQLTLLAHHEAALAAGLAKAIAYNPGLQQALKADEAKAAVAALARRMEVRLGGAAVPVAHQPSATAALDAISVMRSLSGRALDQLDALIATRVAALEAERTLAAAVLVAGLGLALYLFMSFGKVLAGGLREAAFHIDAMRDGNLTTQPRAWGRDEAAGLMGTLAQMQQSLRRIVSQVRSASDSIVGASTQIASGASDLSARTEQSASHLQETASAMEQIAATLHHGEDKVSQATALAARNAQAAEQGGLIVGEVVQTMEGINASSGRIGDIVGTIDSIAFQTNILALNAAVEAARAGDNGRGFAVVAGEVRALAQRSASAAREIKTLIGESVVQVEKGVDVVRQAGQAMGEMVETAQRVRGLLGDVAGSTREQTAGVTQSAQAVQQLDSATQQNAALVEQTAAAAAALQQQAHGLHAAVSRFQLTPP